MLMQFWFRSEYRKPCTTCDSVHNRILVSFADKQFIPMVVFRYRIQAAMEACDLIALKTVLPEGGDEARQ